MKGILTNCATGKVSEVEVRYEITYNEDNQPVFELRDGPTGYESFRMTEKTISQIAENGWTACMGTKNVWDKIFIPAEEMRKAFETLTHCKKCGRDMSKEAWFFPGCQYCIDCVEVQAEDYDPTKHGKLVILITE